VCGSKQPSSPFPHKILESQKKYVLCDVPISVSKIFNLGVDCNHQLVHMSKYNVCGLLLLPPPPPQLSRARAEPPQATVRHDVMRLMFVRVP
jgi:hypothetical protein